MTSSWRQSSMTSRTALVCELRLQRSAARRLRRHHVNLLRLFVVTRQRMRDTWPATWHPAVGRRLAPPSGRLTVGGGICTNNICQLIYLRKTGVLYHTNVTPSSYAHLRWNIGLPFRNQPACHLLLACVVTAECRVSRIICSASRHLPWGWHRLPWGRGHLPWGRSHLPWGRGHLPRARAGPPSPRAGPPSPRAGPPTLRAEPPTPRVGPPSPRAGPPSPRAGPPTLRPGPPTPRAGPHTPRAGPPTPRAASMNW